MTGHPTTDAFCSQVNNRAFFLSAAVPDAVCASLCFALADGRGPYSPPCRPCSGIQLQFLQTGCRVQGPSRGLQAAAESKDGREPDLARRPWTEERRREGHKAAAAAGNRGPAGKAAQLQSDKTVVLAIQSSSRHRPGCFYRLLHRFLPPKYHFCKGLRGE